MQEIKEEWYLSFKQKWMIVANNLIVLYKKYNRKIIQKIYEIRNNEKYKEIYFFWWDFIEELLKIEYLKRKDKLHF